MKFWKNLKIQNDNRILILLWIADKVIMLFLLLIAKSL